MQSAEIAADLAQIAVNDPKRKRLHWSKCSPEQLAALVAALPTNTYVESLSFGYHDWVDDAAARRLIPALAASRVWQCRLRSYGKFCTESVGFELSRACLPRLLDHVLANSETIPVHHSLDLSKMGLQDDAIATLARALAQNTTVRRIQLDDNAGLTDDGLAALLPALRASNCSVHAVSITGCTKLTEGLKHELQRCCAPRALELLAADTGEHLTRTLATAQMWHASFDDDAVEDLCKALSRNTTTNCLDIDGKDLTDRGAESLLRLFSCSSNRVANLTLSAGGALSAESRTNLARACLTNAVVSVRRNDFALPFVMIFKEVEFSDADMCELAAAMRGNTALHILSFEDGVGKLSDAMWQSLSLVLPSCRLSHVFLPRDRVYSFENRVPEHVEHMLSANQLKRSANAKSVTTCRPYQRLLIAALYRKPERRYTRAYGPTLALSEDILLSIIQMLEKSHSSPFQAAGDCELSTHSETFAWHDAAAATAVSSRKRRRE